MSLKELEGKAKLLAFFSVVLVAYPDRGTRDDTCMALGGVLARLPFDPEVLDRLVVKVAMLAGDEEAEKRAGKVLAARQKIEAGEPVTGLPALIELLGLQKIEKRLRKWLNLRDESNVPSDAIVMAPGRLNEVVDAAEKALINHGELIYQRAGELMRIARLDSVKSDDGIERRGGSTLLLPVSATWLVQAMARSAVWARTSEKGPIPADPHERYAKMLLGRAGEWRFPSLKGITTAPTLAADGRLIQEPGFDHGSGLFLDFSHGQFPSIPEVPSKDDAVAALQRFEAPLREFPFADGASKSVAISAMLTGLVRGSLRTAPLHAFDAPTPGTGKTLLASIVGILVTGNEPPAMSQGADDEEDEKRLVSALRTGDPVLLIDNCYRPISGDFLNAMLTQSIVQGRLLGQNLLLQLPTQVLLMATGNNLEIPADMARRSVICRLDAQVESPEMRSFSFDPIDETHAHRGQLVAAGLTLLRAFISAGWPAQITSLGSFKDYDLIRGALAWLGRPDPVESIERIRAEDSTRSMLTQIMQAWREEIGMDSVGIGELRARLDRGSKLCELLSQTAHGKWDGPKIGKYLKRHKDRPANGMVFRSVISGNQSRWRLDTVGDAPPPPEAERRPPEQSDFRFF